MTKANVRDLYDKFPNLENSPHIVESWPTSDYNCLAWVSGSTDDWLWPFDGYLSNNDPGESNPLTAIGEFIGSLGYVESVDGLLENGVEKIVVFVENGDPKHVAWQKENGMWTSKIGENVDMEHTLEGLAGGIYGVPKLFFCRPRTQASSPVPSNPYALPHAWRKHVTPAFDG